MRVELEIWRQDGPRAQGFFESHVVEDAEPQMSLLELLDRLNDQIIEAGGEPVVFESNCREGVCGACGFLVNGVPHGPLDTTTQCGCICSRNKNRILDQIATVGYAEIVREPKNDGEE